MSAETLASAGFDAATDVRRFPRGEMRVVDLGTTVVGRAVFQPGWSWSEHVRPSAGTASCQVRHVGYIVSGRLAVRMDDGTEAVAGPGDVVVVPPGHDGRVVGDEPCVMLDWAGGGEYAAAHSAGRERD